MSNWKYADEMFNKERKIEFIDEKWNGKIDNRLGFFRKSAEKENEFKKDIYEFNEEELKELLEKINATTENSFRSQLSTLTGYLDWAIEKGYRTESNPLPQFSEGEYGKYIKKKEGKYITYEQLLEGVKKLVNPQDRIIPLLLWYNVSGNESNELAHLEISDLYPNKNMIIVPDIDDNSRPIFIDEYTMSQLQEAAEQIYYQKNNGKMIQKSPMPTSALLAQTGYLIKSVNTNVKEFGPVEHNIVAKRFDMFKRVADLPNVTPTSIAQSKHIADAWKIKQEKGELTDADLAQIGKDNGLKETKFNGKIQINVNRFKPYMTDEILEELYGE